MTLDDFHAMWRDGEVTDATRECAVIDIAEELIAVARAAQTHVDCRRGEQARTREELCRALDALERKLAEIDAYDAARKGEVDAGPCGGSGDVLDGAAERGGA